MQRLKMGSENDHCGFSFNFKLPSEDLALRSVVINDGTPELIFDAALKVPTLTEEDVGIACRLACEGVRPEFFYISIPFQHPFHGRQYKHYSPKWLKGTTTGELLAEVDWTMKCLNVGARSDKQKTRFWAWQETSELEGLATRLDFPTDKPPGSIIMSCDSVQVQTSENEMIFLGEPKLRIQDDASSSYTNYITTILDSIAYHDEPLFLKMQELIKLVLAAEWLIKEKGIRFSHPWMKKCSSPQLPTSQSVEVKSKGPDEDEMKEVLWSLVKQVPEASHEEVMTVLGPLSVNTVLEKAISQEGIEVKVTRTVLLSGLSTPKIEKTIALRSSINNYNWLYSNLNPNMPIIPEIPGNTKAVVPNVKSWTELFSQTDPWPRVWKMRPYCEGAEFISASGGICTSSIPITKVTPPVSQTSRAKAKQQDNYAMNDESQKIHVKANRGQHRETRKVTCKDAPKVTKVKVPPKDVTSNTRRTQINRIQQVEQCQGWEDDGQKVMYNARGRPIKKQRSLRSHVEEHTAVNGKRTGSRHQGSSFPLMPQISSEGAVQVDQKRTKNKHVKEKTSTKRKALYSSENYTTLDSEEAMDIASSENSSAGSPMDSSLPQVQPQQAITGQQKMHIPQNQQSLTSGKDTINGKSSEAGLPERHPKVPSSIRAESQPALPQVQAVRVTDLFSPSSEDSGISLSTTVSSHSAVGSSAQQNSDYVQKQENKMPTFDAEKDKSDSSSDDSGQNSPEGSELDED